ncbi:hypothetical protein WUBG_07580 [Wuchereria bancrofti]|uniref:Uncharacterized protein n=1 Tax=Wuchereria bancrofti TaxID=6293 RepID=J9F2C5_WUCBA|nr:hypothetical protein WUBG_07580 [Wuchereria bancrofti]
MSFWWRILTISFLFTLAVSVFAVVVVVTNCFSEPQSWSSLSRPFCGNLQTVITEHSFPLTISGNFFLSITSLLKSYIDAAGAVWQEFEQKTGLVAFVKDSYYLLYMKLVSVGLLVQGYVVYKYDSFITFYNAYAADAVDNILKNMWLLLRIFGLMVADLLMFIVGEGLLFVSSVVETIFTYAYRGDQLAEVLQNWWNKITDITETWLALPGRKEILAELDRMDRNGQAWVKGLKKRIENLDSLKTGDLDSLNNLKGKRGGQSP